MASISRQFTTVDGEIVTMEVDASMRWTPQQQVISPLPEEQVALEAALRAFDEGRLTDAKALLARFERDGLHPGTFLTLARAFAIEGDFNLAGTLLERAEERFPQEPQVWRALAILRRLEGRYIDELAYRRKLLFAVPKAAPGAHLAFVLAYARAFGKEPAPPLGELRFVSKALQDRPITDEASRQERLAFAEQLYAIKPMVIDAIKHYRAASPLPSGLREVSVAWTPLHQWCRINELPCRRLDDHGQPGQRPTLARLARVAVLPNFQWIPLLDEEKVAIDGFMSQRARLQTERPESPLLMSRPKHRAEVRMPRELPLIEEPALLIGGTSQYYEHTIEYLGSLAVAEVLGAPDDLPIVVNDDLAPFQIEQFALLGIEERRLLRVKADAPIRFSSLWVPSRTVGPGRWVDPLVPRWYRQRFVPQGTRSAQRKIYVSQTQVDRHGAPGYKSVAAFLVSRGFETILPESLNIAQQVALFAEASHIVGPVSAALTNMVFSPPGAHVIAMFNRSSAIAHSNLHLDALSQACGHRFTLVEAWNDEPLEATRPADVGLTVDLEKLKAALS